MTIFRYILLAITLCFTQVVMAYEHKVIAVVGKEIITNDDLNARLSLVMATSGMQDSLETRKAISTKILQNLIDEKLIQKAALTYKIEIDDIALKKGVANIAAANRMNGPLELYAYIKSKGSNREQFEKQLRYQLLQAKLISTIIEPRIFVSDLELQEATNQVLQEINSQAAEVKYKLAEIVLFARDSSVEQLLTELQVQLSMGADFAHLAKEFSQSQSAERGGEVGWLMKSQLPPEVAEAVSRTAVGAVSNSVHTAQGSFIIKVLDKQSLPKATAASLSAEQLRSVLWQKKIGLQFQSYMQKLRTKSFIELK